MSGAGYMSERKPSLLENVGVPASSEDRAKQLREMQARLEKEELERIAESERAELSDIEKRRKWDETYAAMDLDDIIEIPCIENGEKVIKRFHERGGKLTPVE